MLPSYLLSLREGIEVALIIGIVLGALRKIQRNELIPALWFGTLSAVGVSILSAVLLTNFGLSLEDRGEKIFEGTTMLIAAGVLTWMIFWMRKQARFLKGELEAGVNQAAARYAAGKRSIFWLAFFAVVREGIETALIITAAFFAGDPSQATTNAIQTLSGTVLGLGTAFVLGWMFFTAAIRLDLRRFFQVTSVLLILFAAGLIAHGVHEFNEVGWIPAVIEHVWDLNPILNETSLIGQLLRTLFGYNGNPSLTEMIAYFVYLIVVSIFWRREDTVPAKATAASQA